VDQHYVPVLCTCTKSIWCIISQVSHDISMSCLVYRGIFEQLYPQTHTITVMELCHRNQQHYTVSQKKLNQINNKLVFVWEVQHIVSGSVLSPCQWQLSPVYTSQSWQLVMTGSHDSLSWLAVMIDHLIGVYTGHFFPADLLLAF